MRVPHDYAVKTRSQSTAAYGGDFFGHLPAKRLALRRTGLRFGPVGDSAAALDVRTDKQLHSIAPFTQRERRPEGNEAACGSNYQIVNNGK